MAEDQLVLDASAMVDLLAGTPMARSVRDRVSGHAIHVPAHFDAEVLSAIGRMERAALLTAREAEDRLGSLVEARFERHPCGPLIMGAWGRRANLRLVDALYVELASRLGVPVVSTNSGMAAASTLVELVRHR